MMTPEEYHDKHHHDGMYPIGECLRCQRAEAVCKSKIRLWTDVEADEWVSDFNEAHGYVRPVTRYHCRFCNLYHLKTAKRKHELQRVERDRRKWLIKKAMTRQ